MGRSELFGRLFDAMPLGVVALDSDSRVVFYNRYEERLAGRERQRVLGRRFFDEVAPCTESAGLRDHFFEHVGSGSLDRDISFHFPRPCIHRPRDVRLVLSSLTDGGDPLGVLFVQDVSAVRAVERTKDFLVRTLAHDMNNPLMQIATGLDLFEASREAPRKRELWDQTFAAIERLRSMVLNLHDITRLHTAEMPLRFEDVDACVLAAASIDDNRAAAALRGISLRLEHDEAPIEAEADRGLLRRAIDNLLENAIRFTPDGGTVSVAVRRRGMRVAFEVADRGPGVPPALRDRIFDADVSAGAGPANGTLHRGLGLAFVDLAARAHGGGVVLDCPPAGGSVFTLEMPVTQTRARAG